MIVAGFGFRSSAELSSFAEILSGVAGDMVPDLIATAADKASAPVFQEFAAERGLRVVGIDRDVLAKQETLTHSAASEATFGTGSVAEAAALAAAGRGARLIGARIISNDRRVTCALATTEGQTS